MSVSVKGNRVTRLVDNLAIARDTESAIKGDLVRDEFDINHHRATRIPTLNDQWEKYLPCLGQGTQEDMEDRPV